MWIVYTVVPHEETIHPHEVLDSLKRANVALCRQVTKTNNFMSLNINYELRAYQQVHIASWQELND